MDRKAERIADIIEPDSGPLKVRARVRLLSVEEGAPPRAKGVNYRPNHNFGDAQNRSFYIGQVNFLDRKIAEPGDEFEAKVTFIGGQRLKAMLVPGRSWRIQEGTMLVGIGEILSVEA